MTQPETKKNTTPVLPVYLALGFLIVFAGIFLVEFARMSAGESGRPAVDADALTADSYLDLVTPLLVNADPARGEQLITEKGCVACHVTGAVNNLAPPFAGVADRAKTRRPPLQPEAYLYESITHPTAFEAPGYSAQMPLTYGDLSDDDLGDLIAYLLTRSEES